MSMINFVLSWVEGKKKFYNLGASISVWSLSSIYPKILNTVNFQTPPVVKNKFVVK